MESWRLKRDLEALGKIADRRLPTFTDTRRHLMEAAPSQESLMSKVRCVMKRRPWLAPVSAAALASLLLFVPVSYQATSGYTVRLKLDAPSLTRQDLGLIATHYAEALGTDHVALSTSAETGRPEILAKVTTDDRPGIEKSAHLFVTALSQRGVGSEVSVAPIYALATSPAYAFGFKKALSLDIRRQGRSPGDIERDIQSQLQAASVTDARVSYREKGGCSLVQVVMPGSSSGASSAGGGLDVALICAVTDENCRKSCATSCTTTCTTNSDLKVTLDGQSGFVCSGQASLASVAGLSDDDIARALKTQFESQGCEANVVVRNGEVVSVDPVCKKK